MIPDRTGHRILIIASDHMLGALVGTMVELSGYAATFPAPDEPPDAALVRARPIAAVLLDATDRLAGSDLFASRAARLGVPVFLFGHPSQVTRQRDWALDRGIRAFSLPEDISGLEDTLAALMAREHAGKRGGRRGFTQRKVDGTLDFTDRDGIRWTVYDRRGSDRRHVVDRRFISDGGEVRHCEITEQEARFVSIATLTRQLERSVADPNPLP